MYFEEVCNVYRALPLGAVDKVVTTIIEVCIDSTQLQCKCLVQG